MALRATREFVDPTRAAYYLKKNPKNRKMDDRRANVYAEMMTRGQWKETHQGIALNCDGTLRDGQHRLRAIVISGRGQWFYVFRGLDDDAMTTIDTHKARTISDIMTIDGKPVSKTAVAIARMMIDPTGKEYYANRLDVIDFIEVNHQAIEFVIRETSSGRARQAPVMAPVAKAWFTRDHDRLKEFMFCLKTGIVTNSKNSAASTLYRLINSSNGTPGENHLGVKGRSILYMKTCNALLTFLEYRAITKLYAAESDPFPMPIPEPAE